MKYGCIALVVLLLLAGVGGGWYYLRSTHPPPDWDEEEVDLGEIRQVVSATGSLSALTTVTVGCQISGILASISVDFNDQVKAGQLIAQIDPSTFEAQVQQSTANLENARASEKNIQAQIENLKASLIMAKADQNVAEANLKKAQVQVADAERQLRRTSELFSRKLVSQSDLEAAQTALDSAKAAMDAVAAQVEGTKAKQFSILAQIEASKAQLEGAGFLVKQNQAQLNIAKINLERTKIYSPIDGVVISRAVDVGQTVAANFQAPTLFTIANDLRKMQINTAVDEADIGKVFPGQAVSFSVDAYRGRLFQGKVGQVRLSPTITQNVVNYSVMVDVQNDDLALKPGMTANVEILVEKKEKVVRIPTRAIFFKPPQKSEWVEKEEKQDKKEGKKSAEENGNSRETEEEPDRRRELVPNEAKVWIVNPDGRIGPVKIKTGIANNDFTELVEGKLSPGDLVVVGEKKSDGKGSRSFRERQMGRIRIHGIR